MQLPLVYLDVKLFDKSHKSRQHNFCDNRGNVESIRNARKSVLVCLTVSSTLYEDVWTNWTHVILKSFPIFVFLSDSRIPFGLPKESFVFQSCRHFVCGPGHRLYPPSRHIWRRTAVQLLPKFGCVPVSSNTDCFHNSHNLARMQREGDKLVSSQLTDNSSKNFSDTFVHN